MTLSLAEALKALPAALSDPQGWVLRQQLFPVSFSAEHTFYHPSGVVILSDASACLRSKTIINRLWLVCDHLGFEQTPDGIFSTNAQPGIVLLSDLGRSKASLNLQQFRMMLYAFFSPNGQKQRQAVLSMIGLYALEHYLLEQSATGAQAQIPPDVVYLSDSGALYKTPSEDHPFAYGHDARIQALTSGLVFAEVTRSPFQIRSLCMLPIALPVSMHAQMQLEPLKRSLLYQPRWDF